MADVTVPSLAEATRVWAKIGLLGFGGPAGQIALMHRELVEKRRWISEGRFLHALSYCMLLPGPEAQQLAIYIGWILHRRVGGLVAGWLFVLPGFVTILALSVVYATLSHVPIVGAVFFGLKAAVTAIVAEAVVRIGRRALKTNLLVGAACAAFLAIYAFHIAFPVIVLGAAAIGAAVAHLRPELLPAAHGDVTHAGTSGLVDELVERGELVHTRPSAPRAVAILMVGMALWLGPLALLGLAFGRDHTVAREGIFFAKAAVVTFGGAYAVLAYVAQRAVEAYAWLGPTEMVDGLGLAETTPGPLIMVVEFVGFMGGFHAPGHLSPLVSGAVGAVVATWATFAPCFVWIFLGGPYVESLRGSRTLRGALAMVTASVVGVIVNLSAWFALHTTFGALRTMTLGSASVLLPSLASVRWPSLLLSVAAALALFRHHLSVEKTLAASALLGVVWSFLR